MGWLEAVFAKYCRTCLKYLVVESSPVIPGVDITYVTVLLKQLDLLLTAKNTKTQESLEQVFVFCAIWAFGSMLTVSDDGTDHRPTHRG